MKCPKCQYIGFEPTDRCRNCGFDFSLSPVGATVPDLPLRSDEAAGPLGDFDLGEAPRPSRVTPAARAARRRPDPSADPGVPATAATPLPGADLPLFGDVLPDDVPLVRPSAPGPPLAVRRSTPAASRPRPPVVARVAERQPDPALPLDPVRAVDPSPPSARPRTVGAAAALGARLGAAALDWLLLFALDAGVVYFTWRVSRLPAAEALQLPPAPLAAFLLLLDGGYLALFTALGGQTIGKMALSLKVVSAEDRPPTLGRALLRVAVFLVSVLPAGLGLLPIVFDPGRRGLHDRLAGTRVVRASAS